MRAKRECAGMTRDYGRLGDVQHMPHRVGGNMRDIHKHPEAVHFFSHALAELGQAVMPWLVRRGICPVMVVAVSQSHVARAELMERPKLREVVLNRYAAFDANERRDLARL